ncbi:hypothetical protein C8F04DRAFT_1277424 [Mycena alexandri]|uniref:Uncharacterized protein n=1 Tax=Mycena alexandri TaxID=1745969 RepID=A0AAD6S2D6_9AGAR|nr:hypothetical protein C8F04DRAFT_1277424 [Mycena alexandri]
MYPLPRWCTPAPCQPPPCLPYHSGVPCLHTDPPPVYPTTPTYPASTLTHPPVYHTALAYPASTLTHPSVYPTTLAYPASTLTHPPVYPTALAYPASTLTHPPVYPTALAYPASTLTHPPVHLAPVAYPSHHRYPPPVHLALVAYPSHHRYPTPCPPCLVAYPSHHRYPPPCPPCPGHVPFAPPLPFSPPPKVDFGGCSKVSVTEYYPDDEIFEREERTEASRIKIYKRTILLLLPKHGKIDATVKIGDIYDFACATLERSSGPIPRARDKLLADNLIECCRTRPQDTRLKRAVHVLVAVARQWNDLDILLRTLNAGQVRENILLLGGDDFVSTYKTFGWDAMRQFYADAVNNDQSNARREVLLSRLTQMAADENDSSLAVWCATQEEIILRSLRKVDAAELPAIVNRSLARGGEFLLDIVVPQIRAQNAPVTVWREFLKCLHKHLVTTRAMPSRDIDIVRGLITECVTGLIQSTPAFPQKVTKDGRHHTYTIDPPAILRMIRFCVDTQNVGCCTLIFAKMRDAMQRGDFVRIYPPWQYYTGICADLVQYMKTVPGIEPTLRPFFVDAVDAMLARTWTTSGGMSVDPCNLAYNVSTLTMAAKKAGGASTLREKLTKEILSGCDSRTLQALARSVATEFPRAESEVSANDDILATLVRAAIDKFSPSLGTSFRSDRYSGGPSCNQMVNLLKFCSEVDAKDQHHYLLSHLLQPPAGSTLEKHVSDSLTPFLPLLKQHLLAQSQSFAVEPYRSFAATVVQTFAEQVMADKPPEVGSETDIQKIGCKDPDCSGCADLRSFLLGKQSTKSFTLPKNVLTHLEHKVARTASWGVICETTRPAGSRSLKITKPDTMMAHTAWSASSEIGKSLLDTLGERAMQEAVLGPQCGWVRARITGET